VAPEPPSAASGSSSGASGSSSGASGSPSGASGSPSGASGSSSALSGAPIERFAGDPPSPWEERYSFSRIVRAGPFVMIGGTTAVDPCGFVIGETPREQTIEILRKLMALLARAGCALEDVVEAHAYVTDISRSDEVGLIFGELFGSVRPLLTMVEVSALIDPRMLVEISLTAYRPA
jgi:enamine deaminase RidA (YjgF/YER057c/UK114 family)